MPQPWRTGFARNPGAISRGLPISCETGLFTGKPTAPTGTGIGCSPIPFCKYPSEDTSSEDHFSQVAERTCPKGLLRLW